MPSLGSTTFLGWHRNCGGIVSRVHLSDLLGSDIVCDKCISRRSLGLLGDSMITDDPYDSSVEEIIATDINNDIQKHLKHF